MKPGEGGGGGGGGGGERRRREEREECCLPNREASLHFDLKYKAN